MLLISLILFTLTLYVFIRPAKVVFWFGAMFISCFPAQIFLLEILLLLIVTDFPTLTLLSVSALGSGFLILNFALRKIDIDLKNSSKTDQKFKKNFIHLFKIDSYSSRPSTTIQFTGRKGSSLLLDYYQNPKAQTCVIQVFGGGYTQGSRKQLPNVNKFFVSQGFSVFALDYRYLPQARWPDPIDDVEDAIDFILKHPEFSKKYKKFIFSGRSSGAKLCLLSGLGKFKNLPSAFILFYPPVDLLDLSKHQHGKILESKKEVVTLMGETLLSSKTKEQILDELSPIRLVDASHPPTLLVHGTFDPVIPVRQSELYLQKLRSLNIPSDLVLCPFESHGFEINLNSPGGQVARFAMSEFLNQFKLFK
jgi:acetyl esterase/lipase